MAGSHSPEEGTIFEVGSPEFEQELRWLRLGELTLVGDRNRREGDDPDGGEYAELHPENEPPGGGEIALQIPRHIGEFAITGAAA